VELKFSEVLSLRLNNFVLAVPKMGHMSKSGAFPKCKVVLVSLFYFSFFLQSLLLQKKNLGAVKLLGVPKMEQMS